MHVSLSTNFGNVRHLKFVIPDNTGKKCKFANVTFLGILKLLCIWRLMVSVVYYHPSAMILPWHSLLAPSALAFSASLMPCLHCTLLLPLML